VSSISDPENAMFRAASTVAARHVDNEIIQDAMNKLAMAVKLLYPDELRHMERQFVTLTARRLAAEARRQNGPLG
jgi:hypothetical protein